MAVSSKRPQEAENIFEIAMVASIIKRHFKFVLSIGALFGVCGALASVFILPLEFRATATIMTKPKGAADSFAGRLAGVVPPSLLSGGKIDQEMIQIQELLKSRQLRVRVIEKTTVQLKEKQITIPGPTDWPVLQMTPNPQVFYLSASSKNPELSYLIVSNYLEELQNYLTESAINQSKRASDFIRARIEEVKDSLDELEMRLMKMRTADRLDPARGLEKGKSIESQLSRAQREYAVQAKVLEALSQQFEQARIDSKRDELMFIVIDPPTVPQVPSGPRKILITFLSALAGLGLSIICLLILARFNRLSLVKNHINK